MLAVFGEDGGIDLIGFGEPTFGAGEVADLARVDHDKRQTGAGELCRHDLLEPAGGLEHDQLRCGHAQALGKIGNATTITGDGEVLT